jgi:hypothetical protein
VVLHSTKRYLTVPRRAPGSRIYVDVEADGFGPVCRQPEWLIRSPATMPQKARKVPSCIAKSSLARKPMALATSATAVVDKPAELGEGTHLVGVGRW